MINMETESSKEASTWQFEVENQSSEPSSDLRDTIISHLLDCNDIRVKSQQINEPELGKNEKRSVLEEILDKSHSIFLSRFSQHLLPEHASYFDNLSNSESYEVQFYLNKIRTEKSKKTTANVNVRNRRYAAMKKLMSEGEYFSVGEMRKRNPLLFDQLLGNFLKNPKSEICADQQYQVAHLLLDQIEQDQIATLKQSQLEAEIKEIENDCSTDDSESEYNERKDSTAGSSFNEEKIEPVLWGNLYKSDPVIGRKRWKDNHKKLKMVKRSVLTQDEKLMLINEFTSSMFNNFLQGKDEFDYSDVDNNPEYDDIDQCEIDEQEKYFDSESPKEAVDCDMTNAEDDELDRFMKEMNNQIESETLASKLKDMNSEQDD